MLGAKEGFEHSRVDLVQQAMELARDIQIGDGDEELSLIIDGARSGLELWAV